jgi:hypothetical protein
MLHDFLQSILEAEIKGVNLSSIPPSALAGLYHNTLFSKLLPVQKKKKTDP